MTTQSVNTMKSLHRSEIAATETYGQALQKLEGDPSASALMQVRNEHRDFANELRKYLHELEETPDQSSGAWGVWAKAVEGGAKLFGRAVALRALEEGEKYGLNSYESALNERIPDECKTAIVTTMLPKTREHIDILNRLMSS